MGRNRRVLRARAHARAASLAGPQSCYLTVVELRAGQSAVVTGAASGIGRALALEFARSGLDVALADVEEDALRAAVDDVAAIGVRAIGVRTDVTSADDVQRLAQRAFEAFGDVHVVCNNAGVAIGRDPLWEVDLDAWRWIFDVNVWGVIYGVRAFVPHFVARGTGHVVNTASMAGLTVIPFNGPYNVTKHAVVSLSETLQGELASIAPAVGVTVLCPALTTTRIGDAARNAPKTLHLEKGRRLPRSGPATSEALDAGDVARQTLAAIEADRLYLAVGPRVRDRASARIERLLADIPD